jgi:hypothetical protein
MSLPPGPLDRTPQKRFAGEALPLQTGAEADLGLRCRRRAAGPLVT